MCSMSCCGTRSSRVYWPRDDIKAIMLDSRLTREEREQVLGHEIAHHLRGGGIDRPGCLTAGGPRWCGKYVTATPSPPASRLSGRLRSGMRSRRRSSWHLIPYARDDLTLSSSYLTPQLRPGRLRCSPRGRARADMNAEWALEQVEELLTLLELSHGVWAGGSHKDSRVEDAIEARLPIYRQIRQRVTSEAAGYSIGGSSYEWSWDGLRRDAIQTGELLRRRHELEENLGPQGPRLSAAQLHPWVWRPVEAGCRPMGCRLPTRGRAQRCRVRGRSPPFEAGVLNGLGSAARYRGVHDEYAQRRPGRQAAPATWLRARDRLVEEHPRGRDAPRPRMLHGHPERGDARDREHGR